MIFYRVSETTKPELSHKIQPNIIYINKYKKENKLFCTEIRKKWKMGRNVFAEKILFLILERFMNEEKSILKERKKIK